MTPRILRVVAIAIAIAGAIDPAFTLTRRVKPEVALVAAGRLPDPDLTDRVADALKGRFAVMRGAPFGSAAVVSVGYALPGDEATEGAQPAFAVVPEARRPFASIASIRVPTHAHLEARVPVRVSVHARAANGKQLTVVLANNGVAMDSATRTIAGEDVLETVELSFVPSAAGAVSLQVNVEIEDGASVTESLTTNVGDTRLAVLFFDRRPSWMSTFVRRATEADPRFIVTSRIGTSRGVSTAAGRPPETLRLPSLELFQAVVVGAPDELTADDVEGLEGFMRAKGGAVALLFDQPESLSRRAPIERLMGGIRWRHESRAEPAGVPPASEVLEPAELPLWAESYRLPGSGVASAAIWQTAVGRGRLLVSGALDAWRYRDRDAAAFDRFWRTAIAEAAMGVTDASADATASPALGSRLRPTDALDERAWLAAWVSSRKGHVMPESQLGSLAASLDRAIGSTESRSTVRPMRSAWWMVPFGLALAGEWWIRRRRGLR